MIDIFKEWIEREPERRLGQMFTLELELERERKERSCLMLDASNNCGKPRMRNMIGLWPHSLKSKDQTPDLLF